MDATPMRSATTSPSVSRRCALWARRRAHAVENRRHRTPALARGDALRARCAARDDRDERYPEGLQEELDRLQEEFAKVVKQNFDGLDIKGGADTTFVFEDAESDVKVWLEKQASDPSNAEDEARELFSWWSGLREVHVLLFQLNHGEDDGIFTLRDSSASGEPSRENYILCFECQDQGMRWADRLVGNLHDMDAEVECIGRDEILHLCRELHVGVRIVPTGGSEPEVPHYVQADGGADSDTEGFDDRMDEEELLDIRMSLEDLLPPEEDDLLGSDDDE